nr:hypothetical protein [Tanacetum cinerariifolium]
MHRKEIHLDVVRTSMYILGIGKLCFVVGFEREWILQESREKSQKLGNNGHKNGKKNDTLAIRVKLNFDPRDEIYGMENEINQMAERAFRESSHERSTLQRVRIFPS